MEFQLKVRSSNAFLRGNRLYRGVEMSLEVGEGSLKRRIPPFPVASISSLRTINYHRRPIDVHVPHVLSLGN